MTQHQLVLEYVKEFGRIVPAKMSGKLYQGVMFGSETSKRCRELRKQGKLIGVKDGKFEVFYKAPEVKIPIIGTVENERVAFYKGQEVQELRLEL